VGDTAATESRWQRARYRQLPNQLIVPADESGLGAKIALDSLLSAPARHPMTVLYLFCRSAEGDSRELVLRFANAAGSENELRQTEMGLKQFADRPLVFANACSTSAADPYVANLLEMAFFQRGCRAFIGSEVKVPIVLASRFAALFFHFFFRRVDGAPVSAVEALAQTRLFLWRRYRNLGGLLYCLINKYDLYMADEQEILALAAP
jgi:hypothetical protein